MLLLVPGSRPKAGFELPRRLGLPTRSAKRPRLFPGGSLMGVKL